MEAEQQFGFRGRDSNKQAAEQGPGDQVETLHQRLLAQCIDAAMRFLLRQAGQVDKPGRDDRRAEHPCHDVPRLLAESPSQGVVPVDEILHGLADGTHVHLPKQVLPPCQGEGRTDAVKMLQHVERLLAERRQDGPAFCNGGGQRLGGLIDTGERHGVSPVEHAHHLVGHAPVRGPLHVAEPHGHQVHVIQALPQADAGGLQHGLLEGEGGHGRRLCGGYFSGRDAGCRLGILRQVAEQCVRCDVPHCFCWQRGQLLDIDADPPPRRRRRNQGSGMTDREPERRQHRIELGVGGHGNPHRGSGRQDLEHLQRQLCAEPLLGHRPGNDLCRHLAGDFFPPPCRRGDRLDLVALGAVEQGVAERLTKIRGIRQLQHDQNRIPETQCSGRRHERQGELIRHGSTPHRIANRSTRSPGTRGHPCPLRQACL